MPTGDRTDDPHREPPLPLQLTPPGVPPGATAGAAAPVPPAALGRPRDASLDALVALANHGEAETRVALFVHGVVVTGTLIGERAFFAAQAGALAPVLGEASAGDATGGGGGSAASGSGGANRRQVDAPATGADEPAFVHMRGARVLGGGGGSAELATAIQAVGAGPVEVLWRGRVDAVDGYAILSGAPRRAP